MSTQVRNDDGKLLCDAIFVDGHWSIVIKRKSITTFIDLTPDGDITVLNRHTESFIEDDFKFIV